MRFAHTNIVCINWKELTDFYVKTFNCKILPPVRNQSGEWLDKGTGLKNAKLEGAHLLLPGYGESGPTLEYTNTKILKIRNLFHQTKEDLDISLLKLIMLKLFSKI